MDRGCSPPARKYRRPLCRSRALFHPDLPVAPSSLRMDEHSARKRTKPRFEAGLLEPEFLYPASGLLPWVFYPRVAIVASFFRAPGQRRESAVYHLAAQSFVRESSAFRIVGHLRRLRLVAGPELPLVLNHVRRLHFRRRRRELNVAPRASDHGVAQRRLSQKRGDDGALSHHGEVDV